MTIGRASGEKVECSKCKQEVEITEIVVWDNKIECYKCWEFLINKGKVEELREQLSQYIEIDENEPKESLTLSQLKEVKQIFKDNYFGESDNRSKEIFNALVWKGRNTRPGNFPLYKCLEKIDQEIKWLERTSGSREPDEPEIYTLNCPFCNKKFSCELEESGDIFSGKWREVKEELNEKKVKHIREVHGEGERENDSNNNNSESNQKTELRTNSPPKSNLPNSTNEPPWPLIITGVLLVGALLIGGIFLVKHKSKNQKVK